MNTEDAQKASSKAAKKNKKRNSKKPGKPQEVTKDAFDHESMLVQLKTWLEEAKLNKESVELSLPCPWHLPQSVPCSSAMTANFRRFLENVKFDSCDHARAATLRNQIWVLKDLVNGVRTQIPEDDLNKIIESIHAHFKAKPNSTVEPDVVEQPASERLSAAGSSSSDLDDRKLRNLRKKLSQIEALKERQEKGEKLEENQMEKVKSEQKVKEEIQELEDLLKELMKR